MDAILVATIGSIFSIAFLGLLYGEVFLLSKKWMENYKYHYDDMDKDSRPPACYQLTYRGVTYWSCYQIHLDEWFEKLFKTTAYSRDLKGR